MYRVPAAAVHWDNLCQAFDIPHPHAHPHMLFDLEADYAQERPLDDAALEWEIVEKLMCCMKTHDSSAEQFARLGL